MHRSGHPRRDAARPSPWNRNCICRLDPGLIADLEQTLRDEHQAIHCYAKLAQAAPDREQKNDILEIREDEIGHFQTFAQIYKNLIGRTFAPSASDVCFADYREELRRSFKDEMEASRRYLDIADRAGDTHISQRYQRAAADEQRHAVRLLSMLTLP